MNVQSYIKARFLSAKTIISRRAYVSLAVFVIVVVAVSVAGYARYQHVQAEIAAQRTFSARLQRGFEDWRDDLSQRLRDIKDGVENSGPARAVGGAWGIGSYVVRAVFDYIGNLHIMIPVTIIYFGVGFFGTLKMRVATLIGALIAFLISTNAGIVLGSIIGLLAIAGLLYWNSIDQRFLSTVQAALTKLKARLINMRTSLADR